MIAAVVLASLVLGGGPTGGGAAPPAAPAHDPELVAGRLPDDPVRPLLRGKCFTCHGADYVTQQRLSPAQWQRTVEKMRKFGAAMTDEEAQLVSAYLARYWTVDLPERPPAPVKAPPGAASRPRAR